MGRSWKRVLSGIFVVFSGVLMAPDRAFAAAESSVLSAGGGVVHTGTVRVVAGSSLNVRSGPSIAFALIRKLPHGSPVDVTCQVVGQTISHETARSALWNRLPDGRYVSDAYVSWPAGAAIANCAALPTPTTSAVTTDSVNVRGNASVLRAAVDKVPAGVTVQVSCQLGGQPVSGTTGDSALWDRVGPGRFIADAYLRWPGGRPDIPWCSFASAGIPESGADFVAWAASYATRMKAAYRVPAAVTIAQAIIESGWGRSGLTQDGNSYFGMKCFDSPGLDASGCRPYATHECAGWSCFATSADFRVYDSALASFVDHSNSIATLPRYRGAFAHANDPDRFAGSIAAAGYATSPTYAEDLIAIMREYDLYRYDGIA